MASNYRQKGEAFTVPRTDLSPSHSFNVGDPVRLGNIPAVAMTSSSNNNITIWTYGIYELRVEANAADLSIGDIIYFKETPDTRNLTNLDSIIRTVNNMPEVFNNFRWGYALQTIPHASAARILVKVGY